MRDILAQQVLKIPADKLRVVTPDVGGGFGTKLFPYREYALAAVAAKQLGRPVKWVAERTEHFLADAQGRDNVTTAQARGSTTTEDSSRCRSRRCATWARICRASRRTFPYVGAVMLPGVYDIAAAFVRITAAHTNTLPVDAYRGAGRPEAAYVIERLVDTAARELGITPDALRRKNFIKPKADALHDADGSRPTTPASSRRIWARSGARRLEGLWQARSRRRKKPGSCAASDLPPISRRAAATGRKPRPCGSSEDGDVTVLIGSQSTGQGHHTAYAQLVAEHLDLPPERVHVIQGDTDRIATGVGTGGSSSITCGGASVAGAAKKLADNLKELAADTLEAAAGDLEIADGQVRVAGTDRAMSFADVARSPKASPDMLTATDVGDARRRRPIRTAPTWSRWRSIRRPDTWRSRIMWWWTISE